MNQNDPYIYDREGFGGFDDPFRRRDSWILAAEETPLGRMSAKVNDLEAKLKLADERAFYLTAELAKANARLGITEYRTQP